MFCNRPEAKAKKQISSRSSSSLARAFDHCPVVLFSFLADHEAANLACALGIPQFLPNKHYVIKQEVVLEKVLQGVYPCPANKVKMSHHSHRDLLGHCPSAVMSMTIVRPGLGLSSLEMDAKELPRSLTALEVLVPIKWSVSDPGWPPLLSSLSLQRRSQYVSELPLLPSSLRMLRLTGSLLPLPLPPSLQELDLSKTEFNSPFRHSTLQKVTFPDLFNQSISARDLPKLRELSVGDAFKHPLNDLPSSLSALTLRGDYATSLRLPYEHALDRLPSSLKRLVLHRPYALPLNHLPASLSCLCVSCTFNQELDRLPESLIELDLQYTYLFNQPMNHLPQQLQVLKIGHAFNQPLDNLPHSLNYLKLHRYSHYDRPLDHLPSSLQTLILPGRYNQPLDNLPSSLKTLDLCASHHFNQPLNQLPESVSLLRLGFSFNQPFSRLPRSLTHLHFVHDFNQLLPLTPHSSSLITPSSKASISPQANVTSYPSSLRVLHLGPSFNQPLDLPASLTELVFSGDGCFSQPLPASSRERLVKLHLPPSYRL